MTRNKKILIVIASFIVAIGIGTGAALVIHAITHKPTPLPDTSTTNTPTVDIPKTTEEQNQKGDAAFKAALTAMNSGNTTEAKKQLDMALVLYKAANNENGIANVNAQYPILKSIPKKPTNPSIITN